MSNAAQVETLDQLVDALSAVGLGQIEQSRVQVQVLPDAEFAIQRKTLGHETNAFAGGQILGVHRIAQQRGTAFAGRNKPGEHFHGGGFAAAVGAQKPEDFAAADGEADLVHSREIAEAQGQVMGFDGDVGCGIGSRRDQ
ncbi:hypothetical protein D3C87_1424120 [compost metagenome]